jgi:hypothetical protein
MSAVQAPWRVLYVMVLVTGRSLFLLRLLQAPDWLLQALADT